MSRGHWPLIAALVWGCADTEEPSDSEGIDASEDRDATPPAETDAACTPQPVLSADLVTVNEALQFESEGQVFVPQGVNSYPLLQHVGYTRLDAVEDILAQAVALGRPLLRIPGYLDVGANPARIRADDGSLREEGLIALDRVLAAAAENGVRLILVLTNNWTDFGGAPALVKLIAPEEALPKNAFWSDPRAIALQLAYQTALAARVNSVNQRSYREDPTIFAWELANEARCERSVTPELCDDMTLARWAKRMSDGLRAAGVQQLIAWGGGSGREDYGDDLEIIADSGAVDILTLHMYGSSVVASAGQTRREAAIAWGTKLLEERTDTAQSAGLPLLLEEVNWKPAATSSPDHERAEVLGAWLRVARGLGVGTLPWMIGETGRMDYDGYLITSEQEETSRVIACHE
jgi:mannan endo-1,4-beta-mannosidase